MKIHLFLRFLFCMAGMYFIPASGQGPMITSLSANSNTMVTRTPDSRGWTDPALNHNKLLQQTVDGVYKLIGPYKVIGNPYLFGEHHKADLYAPDAKAFNIYISYNTYNQELEFFSSSNPNTPLVREPGTVDSFVLQANKEIGIDHPLKFVYGAALGTRDKNYFQEVCSGPYFSLYKRYTSDLGYSSSNLAQSELRQFDLQYEYVYLEKGGKSLKKLKPNSVSVVKEFKETADLSRVVAPQDFEGNPEPAFCKAFQVLNQSKKGM